MDTDILLIQKMRKGDEGAGRPCSDRCRGILFRLLYFLRTGRVEES